MTATAPTTRTCPCGSGRATQECCLPIIEGRAAAPTAEACMRSRYTAFTLGKVDYIVESHHTRTRNEISPDAIKAWCDRAEWLDFKIEDSRGGGEDDQAGEVRFLARYKEKGVVVNHHEIATFEREDGKWRFVTGVTPPAKRAVEKVGRNDPCPCGSGKKHKKCCGAGAGA
jgi:SEC-C motif-containing protein